jgi:hypothetical protein
LIIFKISYQCPVCAFSHMDEQPRDHAICACCGTQFGYDDTTRTYREIRDEWLSRGAAWFDTEDPEYPKYGLGWDAWLQLDLAGFVYGVDRPAVNVHTITTTADFTKEWSFFGNCSPVLSYA